MRITKPNHPTSAIGRRYKITNWKEYNQDLKERGSLEVWIDKRAQNKWYYVGKRQRGAQLVYSDACIEIACTIREVYKLPYRQTEGFLCSLIKKMNWNVVVPNYTVINRRRKKLKIKVVKKGKNITKKLYIVVDSTGAKVFGEGEWKVRQHGWSKYRTWRKIHLAINESNGIIESSVLTGNGIDDASVVEPLLGEIRRKVFKLAGDGAYDKVKVYRILKERKIRPIIPPRKRARIAKHGNCKGKETDRDKNIREIRKVGRKQWKINSNYHRRSIAESTMLRFKKIFGGMLTSRLMPQQEIELKIKCKILNRMNNIGMPKAVLCA